MATEAGRRHRVEQRLARVGEARRTAEVQAADLVGRCRLILSNPS